MPWSMAWYVAGGAAEVMHIAEFMDTFTAWLQRRKELALPAKLRVQLSNGARCATFRFR